MRTIKDTIGKLIGPTNIPRLEAPRYSPPESVGNPINVALAVKSMARHMSNEGYELMLGLEASGYNLYGYGIIDNVTDVMEILHRVRPTTIVAQDKREWDGGTAGVGFDERERFKNIDQLRFKEDIFKLTVLKDAHQRPWYHLASAAEMGCHAWITYYHSNIVCHLAPYVRKEHLIRTYHSVDSKIIPTYSPNRTYGCLLSGAISKAYPLRTRLFKESALLHHTTVLNHPGYHRRGTITPVFLNLLSHYKVAICTSSMYGYVLRKIIEATSCGCRVITDLPIDEVLPEIDGNLIRVDPEISTRKLGDLVQGAIDYYDSKKQEYYAKLAQGYYDYRVQGKRLASDIENLRRRYNDR